MDNLLPVNEFTRPGEKLDSIYGIVFHWIGNAGTSTSANARYFENLSKQDPFDNGGSWEETFCASHIWPFKDFKNDDYIKYLHKMDMHGIWIPKDLSQYKRTCQSMIDFAELRNIEFVYMIVEICGAKLH